MKITASQLRMIIKEEVKRAKRVNLHEVEMVDDPTGMSLVDDIKKQLKGVVFSAIGTQFGYDNPDLEEIIEMNVEAEGDAIENIVQNTLEEMDEMGAPRAKSRSTSFKKDDVIVLKRDYDLVRAISGNETSVKSFRAGTRFMVTRVSPIDEPGGVTFDIKQITNVDPKVSRQRGVPGGSLSRESYWIFPEEEELFEIETI